ncbi:MAG: hypothetical protein ABEH43_04495 [Flavobacteriales bacterium]
MKFKYKTGGEQYKNCNTFHPVPKDSIPVPDGKFKVVYSKKYPSEGKMIFSEVEEW